MKNLLIITLVFFTFNITNAQVSQNDYESLKEKGDTALAINPNLIALASNSDNDMTAGDYLQRAGDLKNNSILLGATGYAISAVIAGNQFSNHSDNLDLNAAYVAAGFTTAVVLIMRVVSNNDIKQAGLLLNQKSGLTIGVTNSGGLGMGFNF